MAVPVNLRSDADPAGGNRFAVVNLAAPIVHNGADQVAGDQHIAWRHRVRAPILDAAGYLDASTLVEGSVHA